MKYDGDNNQLSTQPELTSFFKEEMMEEIFIPRKAPISVKNKPEHLEVVIKFPSKPAPHPPKFTCLWVLADVYVVEKGKEEGYFIPLYQQEGFDGSITLVVDLPPYIYTNPKLDLNSLRLVYYDDSDPAGWKEFDQQDIDWKTHTLEVTLTRWIKDPPVGWGGDYT